MRGFRSLVLLITPVLAMVNGCATEVESKPASTTPPVTYSPPPSRGEASTDMLIDLTKLNPGARIGRVAGVRDDMVAVSGIPVEEIPKLASVQFTDSHGMPLASGTVKHSTDMGTPYLIVSEVVPASQGRMPAPGDVAIYIPR